MSAETSVNLSANMNGNMNANMKRALLAGLCVLALGCHAAVTGGYWMPEFSSQQTSGVGATSIDLDGDLGVVTDDGVISYELLGDEGRNRLRIETWKIHGEGTASVADIGGIEFAGNTYPLADDLLTTIDMEVLGILWEPALVKTSGFRLRLALGADLLRFAMKVQEVSGPQSSEVLLPGPDGPLAMVGLDYIPVPLVGIGVEAELGGWTTLVARSEMFDAGYLGISDEFSGTFLNAVGGVLFGKARGFWIFVGYRHFHAEYGFRDDSGDSTLQGPFASASFRF